MLKTSYDKYSMPDSTFGGDKGSTHSYIDIYEKYMEKINNVSLLEIGVQCGYSIKMWDDYFVDSNIYGLDINLSQNRFPELKNLFECDATMKENIPEELKDISFDYIVDDASHKVEDQISSFDIFYPQLKKNGKYFIEDVAGDEEVTMISNHLEQAGVVFIVEDVRSNKWRFDDIMIIITK